MGPSPYRRPAGHPVYTALGITRRCTFLYRSQANDKVERLRCVLTDKIGLCSLLRIKVLNVMLPLEPGHTHVIITADIWL